MSAPIRTDAEPTRSPVVSPLPTPCGTFREDPDEKGVKAVGLLFFFTLCFVLAAAVTVLVT